MALNRREIKERLDFVRFWANYVKTTTNNKKWSSQQAVLINAVMKSASQDPELYLIVKKASLRWGRK